MVHWLAPAAWWSCAGEIPQPDNGQPGGRGCPGAAAGREKASPGWAISPMRLHPAGFEDGSEVGAGAMRCLRQRDAARQRYELMSYFGEACSDEMDLPAFQDPVYKNVREVNFLVL